MKQETYDALKTVFLREKEAIEKESKQKLKRQNQYNYFKAEINNKIYIVIKWKTVIITKIDKSKENRLIKY